MGTKTTHEISMTITLVSEDDDAKIADLADIVVNLGVALREDIMVYVDQELPRRHPVGYDVTDIEIDRTFSHSESGTKRRDVPGELPPAGGGLSDLKGRVDAHRASARDDAVRASRRMGPGEE